MRESTAFRRQARSDIEAATLLGGAGCAPGVRAHVLAKSQQGVEKVMKAAIVMLTHAGTVIPRVRGAPATNMRAPTTHKVAPFADAISLLAAPAPARRIPGPVQAVARVLTAARRHAIGYLDSIAPALPPRGMLHVKNTEYPYEEAAHDWLNPSSPNAFSAHVTQWLFGAADQIVDEIDRVVDVLELQYP